MSTKYKTFNDAGLTALTNHMKVTRNTADANVSAIEELGQDLAGFAVAVDEAIGKKQDELTFDETPTAGSSNPVTSGGVVAYVTSIVGDIVTILDNINGDTSDIITILDEINGEVV